MPQEDPPSPPNEDTLASVSDLLDRGRLREARRMAELAVRGLPDSADSHYALGLALTQLDSMAEADRAFARAAELQPAEFFLPFRMERAAFEEVVEDALTSLPSEFQRHLENVEVAVEDVPSKDLLRDGDVDHDTLGIYQGDTIQASEWGFPDRILLFRRNLENISPDRETLVREIRATVLHEVGHHLGMEEDHLERIESEEEDEG